MPGEPARSTTPDGLPGERSAQPIQGFGTEHPELRSLLTRLDSAARARVTWSGDVRLAGAAYLTSEMPPDAVISSIRALVVVGSELIACRSPDELHVWPGGRREPGESYLETLAREVREETGWQIDTGTARYLGFVAYRYTDPQPADHPYPNPDFTQLIFTGSAAEHTGPSPQDWQDTEGWEVQALTLTRHALVQADLSDLQQPYVEWLISQGHLD